MEISYDRIYLNVERPGSAWVIPVAIPMYMYRIEVNSYEHGLNFLQKQVLKLKVRAEINEERIADLLGIDSSVIRRVVAELENKKLLNGALTEAGREKLQELDGLVVNAGDRKLGYVFQYVDSGRTYPWVVHSLQQADLVAETGQHPRINDWTKGDSEKKGSTVVYLDSLWRRAEVLPSPSEREITQMILNTAKRSEDESSAVGRSLGVKLLNKAPIKVWVCTYLFLPRIGGQNIYHSEWKVIDPFNNSDAHETDRSSADQRYYLRHVQDDYLQKKIEETFDGLETLNGKKRSEYVQELTERIKDKIELDFASMSRIDENIIDATKDVVRKHLEWTDGQCKDQQVMMEMCAGIIRAMESILTLDSHEESVHYKQVLNECGTDNNRWRKQIQKGFLKNFGEELEGLWWYTVTKRLGYDGKYTFRFSKNQFQSPNGFARRFWGFIAASEEGNKIVRALKGRLNALREVNDVRNQIHGTTERDNKRMIISKEQGQAFYETFRSIMNDYVTN